MQFCSLWNDLSPTLHSSLGTLRQFQSTLMTILFHSAYGTWSGEFVTVLAVRTAWYKFTYLLTCIAPAFQNELGVWVELMIERQNVRSWSYHCHVTTLGKLFTHELLNFVLTKRWWCCANDKIIGYLGLWLINITCELTTCRLGSAPTNPHL